MGANYFDDEFLQPDYRDCMYAYKALIGSFWYDDYTKYGDPIAWQEIKWTPVRARKVVFGVADNLEGIHNCYGVWYRGTYTVLNDVLT